MRVNSQKCGVRLNCFAWLWPLGSRQGTLIDNNALQSGIWEVSGQVPALFIDNSEANELHLVSVRLLEGWCWGWLLSRKIPSGPAKYKNPQLRLHFRFPVSEVFPVYISGGPCFKTVCPAWICQEGGGGVGAGLSPGPTICFAVSLWCDAYPFNAFAAYPLPVINCDSASTVTLGSVSFL